MSVSLAATWLRLTLLAAVYTLCPLRAGPALLSCDSTEAQEYEHYGYSHCHDRFGREFHCDYVFCSDALRRNSFHPPPELNERML